MSVCTDWFGFGFGFEHLLLALSVWVRLQAERKAWGVLQKKSLQPLQEMISGNSETTMSSSPEALSSLTSKRRRGYVCVLSCHRFIHFVHCTFKWFKVLHSHAEDSQLVQLTGQGAAGGYHGGQLVNEVVHLVSPPLLDLAVRFSTKGMEIHEDLLPCQNMLYCKYNHFFI